MQSWPFYWRSSDGSRAWPIADLVALRELEIRLWPWPWDFSSTVYLLLLPFNWKAPVRCQSEPALHLQMLQLGAWLSDHTGMVLVQLRHLWQSHSAVQVFSQRQCASETPSQLVETAWASALESEVWGGAWQVAPLRRSQVVPGLPVWGVPSRTTAVEQKACDWKLQSLAFISFHNFPPLKH